MIVRIIFLRLKKKQAETLWKSEIHRPNPIVIMGLFMDVDKISMAFDILGESE